jgi:BASS family bile acid:Na+ symporter
VIVDILLPAALAFIMFALGLTLTIDDFVHVAKRPKAMAAGLFGQVVLVPILGYLVASAWGLPPEMAVGLMIVAACPGGASSGLITHLARGDTALSISLTAVTSIAAVVTMPFIIDLSLRHFTGAGVVGELPVGRLVRGVFFLTTVPVGLGMLIKRYRPALTAHMLKGTERVATTLFLLIVIGTFISQRHALVEHFSAIGPAALTQNLLAMAIGFGTGALAGLGRRDRIAIVIECGLHNAAVGIFIAATVLQTPLMTVPSVIYALLMNVSALLFVGWMRRRQ